MEYCKKCGNKVKPNIWQEGYYCSNCGDLNFDDVKYISKIIKDKIETWEDWKIDEYNQNYAVGEYAKKLSYNNPLIRKYYYFTDDELYILKRQALGSSWKIIMTGEYNEFQREIHNQIVNEINDEIKRRGYGK